MRLLLIIALCIHPRSVGADEWLTRYHDRQEQEQQQDREQRYKQREDDRGLLRYQQQHREHIRDQQIRNLYDQYQQRRIY